MGAVVAVAEGPDGAGEDVEGIGLTSADEVAIGAAAVAVARGAGLGLVGPVPDEQAASPVARTMAVMAAVARGTKRIGRLRQGCDLAAVPATAGAWLPRQEGLAR